MRAPTSAKRLTHACYTLENQCLIMFDHSDQRFDSCIYVSCCSVDHPAIFVTKYHWNQYNKYFSSDDVSTVNCFFFFELYLSKGQWKEQLYEGCNHLILVIVTYTSKKIYGLAALYGLQIRTTVLTSDWYRT